MEASSPPVPVLLYIDCLLRCLMNLARSSRSCATLSFKAAGIWGSWRFFGDPVGVAVADLEPNLNKDGRKIRILSVHPLLQSDTSSLTRRANRKSFRRYISLPRSVNVSVRVGNGSVLRRRQGTMTGGTLRSSSVSDARRVHRSRAVRPVTHHSPMDVVLGRDTHLMTHNKILSIDVT